MIPGKLVGIVNIPFDRHFSTKGFSGYLRFAWRDSDLKEGFIFVYDKVVGAAVVGITSDYRKYGEEAMKEIIEKVMTYNTRVMEVYSSQPEYVIELVSKQPEIRCSGGTISIYENAPDLHKITNIISEHNGIIIFHSNLKDYYVFVENGRAKRVIESNHFGNHSEIDAGAFLKQLPSILSKTDGYSIVPHPPVHGNGVEFLSVIELLALKKELHE